MPEKSWSLVPGIASALAAAFSAAAAWLSFRLARRASLESIRPEIVLGSCQVRGSSGDSLLIEFVRNAGCGAARRISVYVYDSAATRPKEPIFKLPYLLAEQSAPGPPAPGAGTSSTGWLTILPWPKTNTGGLDPATTRLDVRVEIHFQDVRGNTYITAYDLWVVSTVVHEEDVPPYAGRLGPRVYVIDMMSLTDPRWPLWSVALEIIDRVRGKGAGSR